MTTLRIEAPDELLAHLHGLQGSPEKLLATLDTADVQVATLQGQFRDILAEALMR